MSDDNDKATGTTEPEGPDGNTRVIDGVLHLYRDGRGWTTLRWPAYTLGTATWLTPGAPAEALNMPREVGERAVARLHASQLRLPVIHIPGPPDRWALLMQPYPGPTHQVLAALAGHDVGYAYTGLRDGRTSDWGIDLPPTEHPGHEPLSWISPPDNLLPPAELVIAAVTDVLTR
jgi:hypothetical protein